MVWFKRTARERPTRETSSSRPELAADLKLERLYRAVRDFPGRTEADLARIIYGRGNLAFVADDVRRLEAAGAVTRDPEAGGLYVVRG